MRISLFRTASAAACLLAGLGAAAQQPAPAPRDEFFWLGQINKATAVINTEAGLLDRALAPRLAAGVAQVIDAGNRPGGRRPGTVITFEPLLIEAAGPEVTLLHAGRSSQDMHATFRAAILRDDLLALADQLDKTTATLVALAERHAGTIVPNYTNGVAAQPNSYGHYLLGHAAGLARDADRIREAYVRTDRSPMGTTVLNGTSWPLDRNRMAAYLGFGATVDNAYDAAQIFTGERAVEVGSIVASIALHAGAFIEDVMTQYAQPRPWILLQEGGGNTYVSSAMPQKRNPGLLNATRREASTAITLAQGTVIQAHNIPPGMDDPKSVPANSAMVKERHHGAARLAAHPRRAGHQPRASAGGAQQRLDREPGAGRRADAQVPAAVSHRPPFRLRDRGPCQGARPPPARFSLRRGAPHLCPGGAGHALPARAADEREGIPQHARPGDHRAQPRNRATAGGPQPAEMQRMLAEARGRLVRQQDWVSEKRGFIDASLARLDRDFDRLRTAPDR
ncbi:MAG: Argininosuccinate lyase [Xylophilus sp.]|nr:MAG: Argininosuccinate lyase [Xylophilus sp.]